MASQNGLRSRWSERAVEHASANVWGGQFGIPYCASVAVTKTPVARSNIIFSDIAVIIAQSRSCEPPVLGPSCTGTVNRSMSKWVLSGQDFTARSRTFDFTRRLRTNLTIKHFIWDDRSVDYDRVGRQTVGGCDTTNRPRVNSQEHFAPSNILPRFFPTQRGGGPGETCDLGRLHVHHRLHHVLLEGRENVTELETKPNVGGWLTGGVRHLVKRTGR